MDRVTIRLKAHFAAVLLLVAPGLALEGLARVLHPHSLQSELYGLLEEDHDLLWRLRPGYEGAALGSDVRISRLGYRGSEISPDSGQEELIISAGASPAFGWGVPEEQTFSGLIEAELNAGEPARRHRVLNAGVPGYSSFQGLEVIRSLLKTHRPSRVILSYYINDIDFNRFYYPEFVEDKVLARHGRFRLWLSNLLRRSRFLSALLEGVSRKLPGAGVVPYSDNVRVSLADYVGNIREMTRIIKSAGAQPIYVLIPVHFPVETVVDDPEPAAVKGIQDTFQSPGCPDPADLRRREPALTSLHYYLLFKSCRNGAWAEGYKKEYLNNRLSRLNVRANRYRSELLEALAVDQTSFVDMEPLFRKVGFEKAYLYDRRDYIHLSPKGHHLLAEAVFPYFRNRK